MKDVEMKEVYDYDCIGFLLSRSSVYVILFTIFVLISIKAFLSSKILRRIFSCPLLGGEGGVGNSIYDGSKKKKTNPK